MTLSRIHLINYLLLQPSTGSFVPYPGATIQSPCPAGQTSLAGSTGCTQCPAGWYSLGGTVCQSCAPTGYQPAAGQSACLLCAVGSLSDGVRPCVLGNIVVTAGQAASCGEYSCASCGGGMYCSCASSNYYYGGNRRRLELSSADELGDFTGESTFLENQDTLELRSQWSIVYVVTCVACLSGSFCPGDGNAYACPAGTFSLLGSSTYSSCPTGYYAATPQSSSCSVAAPGTGIVLIVSLAYSTPGTLYLSVDQNKYSMFTKIKVENLI